MSDHNGTTKEKLMMICRWAIVSECERISNENYAKIKFLFATLKLIYDHFVVLFISIKMKTIFDYRVNERVTHEYYVQWRLKSGWIERSHTVNTALLLLLDTIVAYFTTANCEFSKWQIKCLCVCVCAPWISHWMCGTVCFIWRQFKHQNVI